MEPAMSDTLSELNRLLRERLGRGERLRPETELAADLALDSIEQLELVVELENHFAIALDTEGDEPIRTIGELVAQIERALGAAR
jgi:acyl carrier protein